jgi:Ca-activated chloride channel family protein
MTSSSWQTARHRIEIPNGDYTPARAAARSRRQTARTSVECCVVRVPRPAGLAAPLVVAASAAVLSAQAPVFRGGVDLVNMGVTVTDKKGALLTDLTADDFEIVEDGRKQTVRYFASGARSDDSGPELHLGLLLDVSRSMADDIGFTRTAAIRFLNTLVDAVDVTLVDFDSEVRVARYGQRDFARLVARIRQQKLADYTAMYDAIGVYLDGAAAQTGRKIVLLYTDGGDTRSSMPLGDLMDLLKASDVTIYAIGAFGRQPDRVAAEPGLILRRIAEATGGQAYFPLSVRELDRIYGEVLGEIRAQYTLGYVSTNDRSDGRWRKVEIKVNRKDAKLRARKGYFAPYKAARKP